jgi:hypothetical protein
MDNRKKVRVMEEYDVTIVGGIVGFSIKEALGGPAPETI